MRLVIEFCKIFNPNYLTQFTLNLPIFRLPISDVSIKISRVIQSFFVIYFSLTDISQTIKLV